MGGGQGPGVEGQGGGGQGHGGGWGGAFSRLRLSGVPGMSMDELRWIPFDKLAGKLKILSRIHLRTSQMCQN